MDEITYILGAGASAGAMPVVDSFVERFKHFLNAFLTYLQDEREGKEVYTVATKFIEQVESHLSFDTFFKKIYHQGNPSWTIPYKKILLLYFLYEHFVQVNSKQGPSALVTMGKKYNLDPRYDALIAGLLKASKETPTFLVKTNFITWNYDLNLFSALKAFLYPGHPISALIKDTCKGLNYFELAPECSLLHMNGLMFHPSLNEIKPADTEQLKRMFTTFLADFFLSNGPMEQSVKHLRFAWESIEEAQDSGLTPFYSKAKEMIERSKKIIIIGYSFPLYNRQIDLSFLRPEILANKALFIQDPYAEALKSAFSEGLGIAFAPEGFTTCEAITNHRSFFVPRDVFA